jgi:hypothetical protein
MLIDVVLKNVTGVQCWVFIDDIIIFSKSAEEYALSLENANIQLRPGKYEFAKSKVQYLGFILSENGVAASADKVKAMIQYSTPKNAKDVRAFLGLASFYRRLVQKFAEAAKPLTILTRMDQNFIWGPSQQEAFDDLKNRLSISPVLAYPNFELPIILTTDASKVAVAAILSQVQDGVENPIAYASRQLNKAK